MLLNGLKRQILTGGRGLEADNNLRAMNSPRSAKLVEHYNEISQISGEHELIAATAHIKAECARRGISAISADSLMSDRDALQILEKVSDLLEQSEAPIRAWAASTAEAEIALNHLVGFLFRHAGLDHLSKSIGGPVETFSQSSVSPRFGFANNTTRHRWLLFHRPRSYELECRSLSARKISSTSEDRQAVEVRSSRHSRILQISHNIRNQVFKGAARPIKLRYSEPGLVQAPHAGLTLPKECGALANELQRVVIEAVGRHRFFRHLMSDLFERIGPPELAKFNVVSAPAHSGFAEAVQAVGAQTQMTSHGALVSYGTGARNKVSDVLGRCFFNSFPAMTELLPRSPLQARSKWSGQNVRSISRVVPVPSFKALENTRVLYAPNFRNWSTTYFGLTVTCFETKECMHALSKALAGNATFDLRIRLKTTAADLASNKNLENHQRGLLPEDVADLFQANNIHDASLGAHSEELERADIIITEGLTAVMFEALERRKPLVLLRRSPLFLPSLPAWTAADLRARHGRNAIYFLTAEDDLSACLSEISKRHKGEALTDAELSDLVWL